MPGRLVMASLAVALFGSAAAAAPSETVDDSVRRHQRDAVESVRGDALSAAAWVRERLSGFHVTPARLMTGLGLLGALITWNKNKRLRRWAILTGLSWMLLLGGAAAVLLGGRLIN